MISSRLRNRAGTSLVEVLVVLVILVIGVLVVLKSYPAGFTSIRHSENISMAGRLAEHEMEFWKNHAYNLPEGVLALKLDPNDPTNTLYIPDLDQTSGPPMTDQNVSCFRNVIGEVTRIPVGQYYSLPGANDIASVYVLGFSPIRVGPMGTNGPVNLQVYGGNMRGMQSDSGDSENDPWTWLRTRYAIDYDAKKICFPDSNVDQNYYISYSYYLSSAPTQLYNVIALNIPVPAHTAMWLDIPGVPAGAVIDDGSETVARGFHYIPTGTNWSGDPYEYKLVDPIVGTLAFNPSGYEYKESTDLGVRLLEAHITYDILDLQIIREDHMIPQVAPFKIKLTLPFIKQSGVTMEANDQPYAGLGDGAIPGYDVLIVNPGDGAKLLPVPMTDADYKAGSVPFASSTVSALMPDGSVNQAYPIAGKNLRFYYQAQNDWSVQLQKAYERYTPQEFKSPYDISYKQFLLDATNGKLYFKKCDCNKTVDVTYKYDNGADIITEVGESHQISADWVNFAGKDFSYITLNHPNVQEVVSVSGVSLITRAVWRERKNWLHVDLESSLTRRPTEL